MVEEAADERTVPLDPVHRSNHAVLEDLFLKRRVSEERPLEVAPDVLVGVEVRRVGGQLVDTRPPRPPRWGGRES